MRISPRWSTVYAPRSTFEWEYRFDTRPLDDFHIRFGLVDLVRGPDNRLERIPNAAFSHFQKLAKTQA